MKIKQLKTMLMLIGMSCAHSVSWSQSMVDVKASDPNIQYIGRTDHSDPDNVYFAYPGTSIRATFEGTRIDAVFTEGGMSNATTTNYFNIIIDGGEPVSLKLSAGKTEYTLASGLPNGTHTVELFKRTETSVGPVTFHGFKIEAGTTLQTPDPLPEKKIMFIGNSITCGYGNESSANPPVSGFTSANENNYKAWGAVTARNIGAQYHCIAYSGRGLYQNNNGSVNGVAPVFFNQTIADNAGKPWDHSRYVPDIVVINLGTNDFAAETSSDAYKVTEEKFAGAYTTFINDIRSVYPQAHIICANGVMMSDFYPSGAEQWTRIQNYTKAAVSAANNSGDSKVYFIALDPQEAPYGEDWHPTAATDVLMADQLTAFINDNITLDDCQASVELGSNKTLSSLTFPYTITAQTSNTDGATFTWYKNGNQLTGAQSAAYTISSSQDAAGTYTLVAETADCTVEDEMEITAQLVPVGTIAPWDFAKSAAVVFTFDDWSAGHPAIAVPELDSRNMKATFSIVPSIVGNWSGIAAAAQNGHEMANHSMTHTYADSRSLYESEAIAAQTAINTNVPSQKVSTYIYPFGSYDDNLINYLKQDGYVGARGVYPASGNYTYNFATTENDYFNILTVGMDNSVTLTDFTSHINNVISGGGLLTYLYHSITSPTVVDNNYAPVSQTDFQAQLDAALSYNDQIWITTFSAALKYHREAKCATLSEVSPADGSQWVLKLSDTLSNDDLYNQPLFISLDMDGYDYSEITQGGETIEILSKENGTVTFRAVPDAGDITLSTGGGVSLAASASETNINALPATITFTAEASVEDPNSIASVQIDLSAIGGSASTAMTLVSGNSYEYEYTTPAELSAGDKTLTVTVTDNEGNEKNATIKVHIGSLSDGTILVRARGDYGGEKITLEVDGKIIDTWTLTTTFADYTAVANVNGKIRVNYINDDLDLDAQIDYITVAGKTYQAEDQAINTGLYANGACGGGGFGEYMHCPGYIEFVTDPVDLCPNDPNKTEPGECGCGKEEGTCDFTPIELVAGWNLIGYPFIESAAIETGLANIISEVQTIKDNNGFWDADNAPYFNSLTKFDCGKGYLIKVNNPCTLEWNK